jgi:phenylacetate-CoA ligase
MEEYVLEIERFKPIGLMGAASYMYPLARYLRRTGRKLPPLRYIRLHVEVASRIHRDLIEEVFQCPVYCCYVSSEMGFVAVECTCGQYHAGPGVHLEVLVGDEPAKAGQLGRLVATTLTTHNRLTPLLRYEIGDLAVAADQPCACPLLGELETLGSIEGRGAEAIRGTAGRILTPRAVDDAISPLAQRANVAYYNLIQEKERKYLLEIVPREKESGVAKEELLGALTNLLGGGSELEVKVREEIPPTMPAGRYRLCYSLLEDALPELC